MVENLKFSTVGAKHWIFYEVGAYNFLLSKGKKEHHQKKSYSPPKKKVRKKEFVKT